MAVLPSKHRCVPVTQFDKHGWAYMGQDGSDADFRKSVENYRNPRVYAFSVTRTENSRSASSRSVQETARRRPRHTSRKKIHQKRKRKSLPLQPLWLNTLAVDVLSSAHPIIVLPSSAHEKRWVWRRPRNFGVRRIYAFIFLFNGRRTICARRKA